MAVVQVPVTPTFVVTIPAAVIMRRVPLSPSATYRLPASSTARSQGELKLAAAPRPSALPLVPAVPARVLTTPDGVILRMVLLP